MVSFNFFKHREKLCFCTVEMFLHYISLSGFFFFSFPAPSQHNRKQRNHSEKCGEYREETTGIGEILSVMNGNLISMNCFLLSAGLDYPIPAS